ncbi:MAG TPA: 30S ribosomal protein S6 [Polyangiales bacterium]|nr:30S ribosomal protein S6 [Polyangiales bacterium]
MSTGTPPSETTRSGNPRRLREYETIYILTPSVDPDEADRIATRLKEIVSARSGRLVKIDNWGKRKLAYPINKSSRGVFVFLKYLGFEDLVAEIERNLRLIDAVVRYQTVLMNGDVKQDTYQIDPADLEFRRLEVSAEPDEELGVAQRLGLVDMPRPPRGEGGYGDEGMGMEDDNGVPPDEAGNGVPGADEEEVAS